MQRINLVSMIPVFSTTALDELVITTAVGYFQQLMNAKNLTAKIAQKS